MVTSFTFPRGLSSRCNRSNTLHEWTFRAATFLHLSFQEYPIPLKCYQISWFLFKMILLCRSLSTNPEKNAAFCKTFFRLMEFFFLWPVVPRWDLNGASLAGLQCSLMISNEASGLSLTTVCLWQRSQLVFRFSRCNLWIGQNCMRQKSVVLRKSSWSK